MEILKIDSDNKVTPTPSILLVEPFKSIWNKDKSKTKEVALNHFTYIEFYCSLKPSNPYADLDDTKKQERLKTLLYNDVNYQLPNEVELAIEEYKKYLYQSSHYLDYLSALDSKNKIKSFLDAVNLNERNKIDNLVHDINKIAQAAKTLLEFSVILDNHKNKVLQDCLLISTKTSKNINPLER